MKRKKGELCRTVTKGIIIDGKVGFPQVLILGPGPDVDSTIVRVIVAGRPGEKYILEDEEIIDGPDPEEELIECGRQMEMF